jgi:hypothetical protein
VLVGELVEGLAGGDDHQNPPEIVAVVELGEAAAGHSLEEAVEGVLDHVVLVGLPAAGGAELVAGQGHELAVVAPRAVGRRPGLRLSAVSQPVTEPSDGIVPVAGVGTGGKRLH